MEGYRYMSTVTHLYMLGKSCYGLISTLLDQLFKERPGY
jgi:hypothetical protein